MTEDKLVETGLPAHGLVFLDLSWVLALPLYLYLEPWGRNLELKPSQSRFHPIGKSPSRTPGPDARDLGVWTQMPGTLASGPWTPQNFHLRFPKTLWALPFGQKSVLVPKYFGKHPKPLPVNSVILPETKHYYSIY